MSKDRLVALVVTHNRKHQLQQTVRRLLESDPADLQAVVIYDNASLDGTADWLARHSDPRLDVLRQDANGGGAAGFEQGMRYAVDRYDPDWLVVMDDDGRPKPGALAAFHKLDWTGWDAVASAVYFPDGRICDMNRPSRNPFWHGRVFLRSVLAFGGRDGFHLSPRDYAATTRTPVDIASFVGLFLSRDAILRAGYPDGRLFLYGDDGLYTIGLRQTGGRIAFDPRIQFDHDCSTFVSGTFTPLWKAYYYHRNLLMLYRRAAGRMFWLLLLIVIPKWIWKARAHKGQRCLFLHLLVRAIRDGLAGHIGTDHTDIVRLSTGIQDVPVKPAQKDQSHHQRDQGKACRIDR